ncbi:MAG: glycosyltransferase family 2 protein [Rhodoferax sp.]|nr:glycosyltransferase family 2 protein [Rhodoferax sp.]
MITVIIPYYQRSVGVLAKALASIAAQQSCPLAVHVIVVDDASLAPAGPELASAGPMPHAVQVIAQPNGGPGAARNTGLDNAPRGTRYLAFLDSDDEWAPDHLARAVAALDRGYDLYFADHYQLGQTTSAFSRAGRIEIGQHPSLPSSPAGLHAYQGDMLDQIIRGNLIGTSTVVYSFERFAQQRFRIEFTNAGEDYLFWMELVQNGAKIAFSSQCEARYGKGVNVYAGAGWGSEQHLLRLHNELKYRKTTNSLFKLNASQQSHIQSCIRDLRLAFARDLLHRLSHRQPLPWTLLKQHFELDPRTFLELPKNVMKSVASRRR